MTCSFQRVRVCIEYEGNREMFKISFTNIYWHWLNININNGKEFQMFVLFSIQYFTVFPRISCLSLIVFWRLVMAFNRSSLWFLPPFRVLRHTYFLALVVFGCFLLPQILMIYDICLCVRMLIGVTASCSSSSLLLLLSKFCLMFVSMEYGYL